jgi:hypothetical protein
MLLLPVPEQTPPTVRVLRGWLYCIEEAWVSTLALDASILEDEAGIDTFDTSVSVPAGTYILHT